MKLEVKTISKQTIKPSSPTPPHLKTFHLSLLDQLLPPPYAPLILFYPNYQGGVVSSSRLDALKSSLSETLTRFYPLAGTLSPDDLAIDCDDRGANFVEARADCTMNRFLTQPDLLSLPKLLPVDPVGPIVEPRHVSNVQVTEFACGGIAIGICISHKILDGVALGTFLKAWTATAAGGEEEKETNSALNPNFIAGTLFPAGGSHWLRDASMPMWGSFFKTGKCVTRRIVFDSAAIRSLKARIISPAGTRVEIVSALLWKSIMEASERVTGTQKPSLLTHLVNLRKRVEPPLSENSLGNLLWISSAKHDPKTEHPSKPSDLGELAGKVRESISKIDDGFVGRLRGKGSESAMAETFDEIVEMKMKKEGADFVGFSSWCRMGFYGSDFGWGKPIWVSSYGVGGSVFMNLVILADTPCGEGVEAWVTMDEDEMAVVAGNEEMTKFAKFDPSPLVFD
ncbi:unnamed protein product [Linum tenue]|uniref:Uncharacterized protein n=2 Tax=Linum tenue TaxID=586396 RepID=A0AAV0HA65_9ROSI|nr:unnamed protein product [Linum tenue]